MIVQFFRYGNGLSKGPLDYLLGKERDREHAQILSGSEQEVAELIDSSPYAKKYTSGCLSFYEGDLSDEDKTRIMKEFERCLFPGMDESQYRVLWIEHKDKLNPQTGENRLELNFLIPNTEIITGQRLQPFYHQSDLSRVDLFKKVVNFVHDLHDPNDPINKQAITDKKGLPEKTKEIKQEIDIQALIAIEKGLITDRKTMVSWLTDTLGLEIAKVGKKTLTIKHPFDETAPNIRLPGPIYAESFRATEQSAASIEAASREYREAAAERYRDDLQRYEKYLAQKGSELEGKYRLSERGHSDLSHGSDNPSLEQDRGKHQDSEAGADLSHEGTLAATSRPDQEPEITLATVECLEPRSSRTGQYPQNPFEVEYSLDFDSMYRTYMRHLFDRSQQRKADADSRKESTDKEIGHRYTAEAEGSSGLIHPNLQRQSAEAAEIIDHDPTSSTLRDYRAAAAAIEEATAAAGRSLKAHSDAITDYSRVRRTQQRIEADKQQYGSHIEAVEIDSATMVKGGHIRAFLTDFTTKISDRFRDVCSELGQIFGHKGTGEPAIKTEFAGDGASRDHEAAQATRGDVGNEVRLSGILSKTTTRFNPTGIFEAIEVINQRQEQKKELSRNNDYDSPGF